MPQFQLHFLIASLCISHLNRIVSLVPYKAVDIVLLSKASDQIVLMLIYSFDQVFTPV